MSLRIEGPDLDPDELTTRLGVEPTDAHRRGEIVRQGAHERRASSGHWGFSLGMTHSDTWDLDGAINAMLDRLPTDEALWRDIAQRYQLDVFCGLFMGGDNQGTDLQPATLARMTARGLALGFDVHGP